MDSRLEKQFNQFQSSLQSLLSDLDGLSDETLNKQPQKGKWSAIQGMYHSMFVEQSSLGYIKKKLSQLGEVKYEKSGVVEMAKSIALIGFLRSPIKVKAPKIVEDVPDSMPYEELKTQWMEVRKEMKDVFESFPKEALNLNIYKHPLAGRMSIFQAMNFLQAHYDRHHKQILQAVNK
ncbi:MAG: hypothetical protein ACI81T_003823 [Bacteroidia bacterium]|jgi:hypothetical protein